MKKLEQHKDIKELKVKYRPDLDKIFYKEDKVEILKFIISDKLDQVDRNIILMYLDNGFSISELSKDFSCSGTLARNKVKEIKEKIKEEFIKYLGHDF